MSHLPKLNHFNYDELDVNCNCGLCSAERRTGAEYSKFLCDNVQHSWTCQCETCKIRNKLYENYLIAGIKRDTFSELSYLTQDHTERGPFLAWVWRATQKEDSTTSKTFSRTWWLNQGMIATLGWWLDKWKMLSGVDLYEKEIKREVHIKKPKR